MKRCWNCQQVKPLDEFHRYKESKDGRKDQCKACMKAYHRRRWEARYGKDPAFTEIQKQNVRRYHEKLKAIFQANPDLTKTCKSCGETKAAKKFPVSSVKCFRCREAPIRAERQRKSAERAAAKAAMTHKTCRKCDRRKAIDEFRLRRNEKGREFRIATCRQCESDYVTHRYHTDSDFRRYQQDHARMRLQRRRAA